MGSYEDGPTGRPHSCYSTSLENTEDGESDEKQVDDDDRRCRKPGLHHPLKAVFASTEAAQLFKILKQRYDHHDESAIDESDVQKMYDRTVSAVIIEEQCEGVVADVHEDRHRISITLADKCEQHPDEQCRHKLHQISMHQRKQQCTDDDGKQPTIVPKLIIDEPSEHTLLDERRNDDRIQNHPEAAQPSARYIRGILERKALLMQKRLDRRKQDRAERLQTINKEQQPEILHDSETRMPRPWDAIAPEQEKHHHEPEQAHRNHRKILMLVNIRPILDQKTTAYLKQKLIEKNRECDLRKASFRWITKIHILIPFVRTRIARYEYFRAMLSTVNATLRVYGWFHHPCCHRIENPHHANEDFTV